jgi:hypothetical protein
VWHPAKRTHEQESETPIDRSAHSVRSSSSVEGPSRASTGAEQSDELQGDEVEGLTGMSTGVRWALAALCSLTAVLAVGSAAAWAAPPETPETGGNPGNRESVGDHHRDGDPERPVEPGSERARAGRIRLPLPDFLHRQSEFECAEGDRRSGGIRQSRGQTERSRVGGSERP